MSVWAVGVLVLTAAFALCGVGIVRGSIEKRLVGLQLASALASLDMLVLAQHFGNAAMFDAGLMAALLGYAGGLVYARFFGRWL